MSLNSILATDSNSTITKKSATTSSKANKKKQMNVDVNSDLADKILVDEECILDNLSEKYKKKTQLEHIKDLPDTYMGSIIQETTNVWTIPNISDLTYELSDTNSEQDKIDNKIKEC